MIILLEHFKSKFQALPVTFFTASVAFFTRLWLAYTEYRRLGYLPGQISFQVLAGKPQLFNRVALDLANPLAANVELLTYFRER
jgi:hypothetical protein